MKLVQTCEKGSFCVRDPGVTFTRPAVTCSQLFTNRSLIVSSHFNPFTFASGSPSLNVDEDYLEKSDGVLDSLYLVMSWAVSRNLYHVYPSTMNPR